MGPHSALHTLCGQQTTEASSVRGPHLVVPQAEDAPVLLVHCPHQGEVLEPCAGGWDWGWGPRWVRRNGCEQGGLGERHVVGVERRLLMCAELLLRICSDVQHGDGLPTRGGALWNTHRSPTKYVLWRPACPNHTTPEPAPGVLQQQEQHPHL